MEVTKLNLLLGIVVSMVVSALIGALITFRVMQASNCQVLYISQNELMEQEASRIANEKLEDKQLFYGKQLDAVRLATILPEKYEGRGIRVVYSIDKVMGKNTKSISKEVHKEIIEELNKTVRK